MRSSNRHKIRFTRGNPNHGHTASLHQKMMKFSSKFTQQPLHRGMHGCVRLNVPRCFQNFDAVSTIGFSKPRNAIRGSELTGEVIAMWVKTYNASFKVGDESLCDDRYGQVADTLNTQQYLKTGQSHSCQHNSTYAEAAGIWVRGNNSLTFPTRSEYPKRTKGINLWRIRLCRDVSRATRQILSAQKSRVYAVQEISKWCKSLGADARH